MLENLKDGHDIVAPFLALWTLDQLLDRRVQIRQAARLHEERVLTGVCFGDGEDGRGGVDGGNGAGVWEAGGGFGEDTAAAADVKVVKLRGGWGGLGGQAGGDESVAERVHEV